MENADLLIKELLYDPVSFSEEGREYDLLQMYFKDLPIKTLIPLIESENNSVQKSAMWIVSELGQQASELLPYIISLVENKDTSLRYYALESIISCSVGNNVGAIIYVIKSMQSPDEIIRILSMRLIGNADKIMIQAGIENIHKISDKSNVHLEGLSILLAIDMIDKDKVYEMLDHEDELIRKYGVIAARKIYQRDHGPIEYASRSTDNDIAKFAKEVQRVYME